METDEESISNNSVGIKTGIVGRIMASRNSIPVTTPQTEMNVSERLILSSNALHHSCRRTLYSALDGITPGASSSNVNQNTRDYSFNSWSFNSSQFTKKNQSSQHSSVSNFARTTSRTATTPGSSSSSGASPSTHNSALINKEESYPDWALCAISKEVMRDPVSLLDGSSYERKEIEKWVETQRKTKKIRSSRAFKILSPMTQLEVQSTLIPNISLKNAILSLNNGEYISSAEIDVKVGEILDRNESLSMRSPSSKNEKTICTTKKNVSIIDLDSEFDKNEKTPSLLSDGNSKPIVESISFMEAFHACMQTIESKVGTVVEENAAMKLEIESLKKNRIPSVKHPITETGKNTLKRPAGFGEKQDDSSPTAFQRYQRYLRAFKASSQPSSNSRERARSRSRSRERDHVVPEYEAEEMIQNNKVKKSDATKNEQGTRSSQSDSLMAQIENARKKRLENLKLKKNKNETSNLSTGTRSDLLDLTGEDGDELIGGKRRKIEAAGPEMVARRRKLHNAMLDYKMQRMKEVDMPVDGNSEDVLTTSSALSRAGATPAGFTPTGQSAGMTPGRKNEQGTRSSEPDSLTAQIEMARNKRLENQKHSNQSL